MIEDLQEYLGILRGEKEIVEINAPIDPYLEAAEIHRRVITEEGPALLFTNIKGSSIPLVTNLFGTKRRIEIAFGKRPEKLIRDLVKIPEELVPPSMSKLFRNRKTLFDLLKIGMRRLRSGAVTEVIEKEPKLSKLPLLTTWEKDGGPFITLPLVYTEHPSTGIHNLGVYRLQRYDDSSTGLHFQIGKGGGFHLKAAKELGKNLPVNIIIGGPPALILSAIAPLPENVPEFMLASLVLGRKLKLASNPIGGFPVPANAELVLVGDCNPNENKPEGPFGDHYGYYSLKHDYPVFRCKAVLRKKNPIFTATVVGKPRQEDFYLGDYLQELLSPIFPLVMPSVVDLWAFGETGYHSLAAAVVKERYKREAMMSAFRILGEGQLSLTKFLLVVDKKIDIRNFKSLLQHVLERADFRSDLYVFSNLSMDTLDYTGPKVNEGSKGVLLGIGEPIRRLPQEFKGNLPQGIRAIKVFCPGCLVIEGGPFGEDPTLTKRISDREEFRDWPLLILVDNAAKAVSNTMAFLWTTFTRFEPGEDIHAKEKNIARNHISYTPPIVIDSRMKPPYPEELECDDKTRELVSNRWKEYFPVKY